MVQLQNGAQKWSDLQDVIAACAAFQKCMVQIICHIAVRGPLVLNYDYEYNIESKDSMGARTKINTSHQTSQILAWALTDFKLWSHI